MQKMCQTQREEKLSINHDPENHCQNLGQGPSNPSAAHVRAGTHSELPSGSIVWAKSLLLEHQLSEFLCRYKALVPDHSQR